MLFNSKLFRALLVISSLFLQTSRAEDIDSILQNALIEDLQAVKYQFSNKYGPAEWKKNYYGWVLDEEFEKARSQILSGDLITVKDYQKIFKKFLNSTRDYHVGASFYSTEASFFPLAIKGVNGRYYVTQIGTLSGIHLDASNQNLSLIQVGDEILKFNGIPIGEVVEKIIEENLGGNYTPTGYALAERTVFMRKARVGVDVPNGMFELTLRNKNRKASFKVELSWSHTPEWVMNHTLRDNIKIGVDSHDTVNFTPIERINHLINKDFSVALAKDLLAFPVDLCVEADYSETIAGDPKWRRRDPKQDLRLKGFLPPLGKILWESPKENTIYAYLYTNSAKQKVGYIYLPSFSFDGRFDDIIIELISIIQKFNRESEALVFDTTNNTGGNMMFMYAVLSLLSDKPLHVPVHREIITQEDVYNAASLYNQLSSLRARDKEGTLSGYSLSSEVFDALKAYALNIINTWESGSNITEATYLLGISEIKPHSEVQYTKPLIVLMNELNLSCGDFFPAILQDNKRATLFGKNTAGAGGYVKVYSYLSRFGIQSFSLTASIAYRLNGNPIENLGVSPDFTYDISASDIRNGYSNYIRAVNEQVKKL